MTYLLDTHVWVWLVEASHAFPPPVERVLKDILNAPLGISAITPWEVAKKASLGRLHLSMQTQEWILQATSNRGISVVPLTPDIAYDANHLPGAFHKDPADQIIVATARTHGLVLVTGDDKILQYHHVKTLRAKR